MRALSFVSAPVVMAATVFGAGWWLRSEGMLHARLTFDAMGGPAAYVLYGLVVGLGVLHLLLDRVVEGLRLIARSRRAGRHPFLSARTSPRVPAGPVPAPLPPLPPATIRRRPSRVVAPAVVTPVRPWETP